MSAPSSDEVALDFKDCLNDLQMNNRYEISNLTIIAKENIEHAQALSRALEDHIRTTAPNRKLPSLYVLDSIVKNVGSPYTIYLGRNLFSTFFDAYTLVDPNTRKSMEAMLRTWKEPVPGSMEPTPVFPAETTRVIENALIKARTAALQTQRPQHGLSPRPLSAATYRNTPTPPQPAGRYGTPAQQAQPYTNGHAYQSMPQRPQQQAPQPDADLARSIIAALGQQNKQPNDLAKLHEDINSLITHSQAEFARNPFDQGVQQRLKALLDLQTILKTQQLSPETIGLIKAQVAGLSTAARPPPTPQTAPAFLPPQQSTPSWQPPNSASQTWQPPPPAGSYQNAPAVQAPPASVFAPGALDALLKSTAAGQKPSTPQLQAALPTSQNLPLPMQPPRPPPSAAPPQSANSLLDALRAAGMTPSQAASTPSQQPPPPPPSQLPASAADLLKSLSSIPGFGTPTTTTPSTTSTSLSTQTKPRIPISQSSLKQFRPDLVTALYSAQPNQCSTCGRRFSATQTGRDRKASHLDWHFRSNQRIADAVHKSLNRSYYIDEMEWVHLVEIDPSSGLSSSSSTAAATAAAQQEAKKKAAAQRPYIPAPTGADAGRVNRECPICQERFEATWSEEKQEWVWMDVRMVGGRAYHASCHDEVKRAAPTTAGGGGGGNGHARNVSGASAGASGGARSRSATPETTLLGKRKAEDPLAGLKARLRT